MGEKKTTVCIMPRSKVKLRNDIGIRELSHMKKNITSHQLLLVVEAVSLNCGNFQFMLLDDLL